MPTRSSPPAFSIVIPTYNRAQLLSRAIDSVLRQTFPDFELVIVDDGPTDEAGTRVAAIGDPRILHIRRDAAGGCADARNAGIRSSRGRYIALLDDDDEYLPCFLEEAHRTFEREGERLAFTWCGIRLVEDAPEGEKLIRERLWRLRFDSPAQIRRSWLAASRIGGGFGLAVRRECFDAVGLFDERSSFEDTDFLLRLLAHGCRFAAAPSIQVKIHRHSGERMSRRFLEPDRLREEEELIVKYADFLATHPAIAANLRDTLCFRHYSRGDGKRARSLLMQRLRNRSLTFRSLRIFLHFEVAQRLLRAGGGEGG
jgi:glycosyltransferase involved in cell wall biosynthesis